MQIASKMQILQGSTLSLVKRGVAMQSASKRQLLQGSTPSLVKQNQPLGAVSSRALRRSTPADAAASESSRLGLQLEIRAGVVRSAHKTSSPSSQLSANQEGPAFPGNSHGSSASGRSSAHLRHSLSSALEAHALTQIEADEFSRAYQDPGSEFEYPKNEEPEDVFQAPIGKLRALLRLWDTDSGKANDYCELLNVVDLLERLGLDIFFHQEVKDILDRVFRVWTENSLSKSAEILGDLQVVGLAFHLLRSHGYVVEPSIFNLYKREDGSFSKTPQLGLADNATSADRIDLVNLLRASDLKYRRDAILHDAFNFASTALSNLLDGAKPLSEKSSAEVKYRLSFPWVINIRMLETRQTILNFEVKSVTGRFSRLSSEVISLMMSTATQLFNHYHSAFQLELEDCKKWSEETQLAEVNVRPPMILRPFHVGFAYEMPQARYSFSRAVWAKAWYLLIVQDDLYEGAHAYTMDEILIFMDAFKQFDPSILEKIPNIQDDWYKPLRAVYFAMYGLAKSWTEKCSKQYQGRDLLRTYIDIWMVRLEIYLNEKRWVEEDYKFTVEEYVEVFAKWSFAVETGLPLFYYTSPGYTFSPSFFVSRPDMEALFNMSKAARFLNDIESHEHELAEGKQEFVQLLMEASPELTLEDAIKKSKELAQASLEDTTEALLDNRIPFEAKQILRSCSRTIILMYSYVDGLRNSNWPLANLCDPLPTFSTVE